MDEAPEPVRAAWQHAIDGWDEPARHDALFRVIVEHNCFAWAARQYKQRGDAIATERLAKLRRAAEASLVATATVRPKSPDERAHPLRSPLALLGILVVAVLLALVLTVVVRNNRTANNTAPASSR
jgi:hypothetical protein